MRVPLSNVNHGRLEVKYVEEAAVAGMVSGTGPDVRALEQAIGARIGRSHVIATCNGTQSLVLLLAAMGIGPGDEVIVPAWTFVAPAAAVVAVGAAPVLVDVDPLTWTIDVDRAEEALTERTKAIIAVSLMGHPSDHDRLEKLGPPVVEDAAQSHGARYRGRSSGSLGIASTFSFHANKAIATGEGGCVATDDAELAERLRLHANHGMTTARPYWHDVAGTNARMANLVAAFGRGQVERWDDLVEGRIRVAQRYRGALAHAGLEHRPAAPYADVTCWLHAVRSTERDALVAALRGRGIDARATWTALSRLPVYQRFAPRPCPHAEALAREVLWLPTWAGMEDHLVDEVVRGVDDFFATEAR